MTDADSTRARQGITVYATSWCPYCHSARRTLDQAGVPYSWVDIEEHPEAVRRVMEINDGDRTVPTIVLGQGQILVAPGRRALLAALRLDGFVPAERGGGGLSGLRRLAARLFQGSTT